MIYRGLSVCLDSSDRTNRNQLDQIPREERPPSFESRQTTSERYDYRSNLCENKYYWFNLCENKYSWSNLCENN